MPSLPKYEAGYHFLTAATFRRAPYFAIPQCARIFCEELEAARQQYAFEVIAFVVMPDHIHLIVGWDAEVSPQLTISKVAWAVKGRSARRIVAYLKRAGQASIGAEPSAEGNVGAEGSASGYPHRHPLPRLQPARRPQPRAHRRGWQYRIWQAGAGYDFNLFTERKLREKIAYIHANPVRAGLARAETDYPWSSAACYAGLPCPHPVCVAAGEPCGAGQEQPRG